MRFKLPKRTPLALGVVISVAISPIAYGACVLAGITLSRGVLTALFIVVFGFVGPIISDGILAKWPHWIAQDIGDRDG